ncbi:MAG: ECF transporter S component [Firmicutes bacterium]|nr:ECF transporter S component [Bacillota bacterium]
MNVQIFILLHILAVFLIACIVLGQYIIFQKKEFSKKKKWLIIGITCGVSIITLVTLSIVFWSDVMQNATPPDRGAPNHSIIVAIIVAVVLIVFGVLLTVVVKARRKKTDDNNVENKGQIGKDGFFTSKNITRMAIFTALALILYLIAPFNFPLLFPDFLSFNFSDIPVLLAGFMMGPIAGIIVLVAKITLKLPFTSTAGVGELADLMFGLAFMLPATIIYMFYKNKKGAVIGLSIGIVSCLAVALLANRFILVPFYLQLGFFGGDLNNLARALSTLPWHTNITYDSFFTYYLLLVVLPFNLIRLLISATVSFFLYKHLSRASKHLFG